MDPSGFRVKNFLFLLCCSLLATPLLAQQQPPGQPWQMRFDGNTAIVLPAAPELEVGASYTFELWVYPERRTSGAVLLRRALADVDRDPFYALQLQLDASGQPGWGQTRGTPGSQMSSVSTTALPLRAWSHLAVTSNGSLMILYLNGTEIRRQGSPGAPPPANGLPIHLGTRVNPKEAQFPGLQYNGFAGTLRQLSIWNRALSAGEIRALMASVRAGNEPGLVSYWPLDDGPGYTFREAGPARLAPADLLYRVNKK